MNKALNNWLDGIEGKPINTTNKKVASLLKARKAQGFNSLK